MLRSIALTAGLLAALPAMAGEMGADEAHRFVIGKMFSYTCFEGTRGQGRVNPDGSVAGTVQFQGSGPVRSHTCRPTRCRSAASPFARRCAGCCSSHASISSGPATTRSAGRFRGLASPIASSRGTDGRRLRTACTAARTRRVVSRSACVLRSPPTITDRQPFAGKIMHVVVACA